MQQSELANNASFKRSFVAICASVFALTFLKGFRMPNAWTATHFAMNYSQGFVRRGLVGEVARRLIGDYVYRYNVFAVFAFTVFTLLAIALGLMMRGALRADRDDLALRAALLVFAASPALVFFIHAIGYNDYIGLLFVLLLVLYAVRARSRLLIFYLVVGAGLTFAFIHEALVVMFGPVMVFAMACHILRCSKQHRLTTRDWLVLLAHGALASLMIFALSSLVSTLGTEDAARIRALQQFIAKHADYPPRPEAFEALQRSSRENVRTLMPWYWSFEYNRNLAQKSWQAFAPGFVWLLYYGLRAIELPTLPRLGRWALRALFLGASLTPLLLNFVGWDWNRWNGLALMACISCILTLKQFLPAASPKPMPAHVWTLGVIATAIGLATTTPLFDNFEVQFFPFNKQWDFIHDLFERSFIYRPRG